MQFFIMVMILFKSQAEYMEITRFNKDTHHITPFHIHILFFSNIL